MQIREFRLPTGNILLCKRHVGCFCLCIVKSMCTYEHMYANMQTKLHLFIMHLEMNGKCATLSEKMHYTLRKRHQYNFLPV